MTDGPTDVSYEPVAQAASLLYRRLLTCVGDVWNGGTRVAVARLPAGSRRNSRQGCLRYKSARPPGGICVRHVLACLRSFFELAEKPAALCRKSSISWRLKTPGTRAKLSSFTIRVDSGTAASESQPASVTTTGLSNGCRTPNLPIALQTLQPSSTSRLQPLTARQ